jgi:hypothetical protein
MLTDQEGASQDNKATVFGQFEPQCLKRGQLLCNSYPGLVVILVFVSDFGMTSNLARGTLTCKNLDLLPDGFVFKQCVVKVRSSQELKEEESTTLELRIENQVSHHAGSHLALKLTDACRATVAAKTGLPTTVTNISRWSTAENGLGYAYPVTARLMRR